MTPVPLRGVDLNLLLPLQALLEERNVTRAANRVNLSQSAMSRVLERLRGALADDLLLRDPRGYQLTPRGRGLQRELELLLPRLERLWAGTSFSPAATTERVRLAMTDYAAAVVLPPLLAELGRLSPGLIVEVLPWHEHAGEDLTAGTADLVFSPLASPSTFHFEALFEERFVCLLGSGRPFKGKRVSLQEYLRRRHVSVETRPGQPNLVDRALAEAGRKRHVALHCPYFLSAVLAVESTDLLLTAPARLARRVVGAHRVSLKEAPSMLPTFQYVMVWHSRLEREPLHGWFREVVRQVCAEHLRTSTSPRRRRLASSSAADGRRTDR